MVDEGTIWVPRICGERQPDGSVLLKVSRWSKKYVNSGLAEPKYVGAHGLIDDKSQAIKFGPAIGPKGDRGFQGPQGDPGPIGSIGPVGPQGLKGDAGPTGAQGAKGDPGVAGPQGVPGEVGAAGPQGQKGDAGAAGAKGDKGDTGASGATLLATVTLTESSLITLALGIRRVTVAVAGATVGGNYLPFPVNALPAGYGLVDAICATAGQITFGILVPVISVLGSYSIPVRVVRINT